MTVTVKQLKAILNWDDLPGSAEVTGRVLQDGGRDDRFEKNADRVVLEFRRMLVSAVRAAIAGLEVTRVEIDDFRI
jgi:hypothetical protein